MSRNPARWWSHRSLTLRVTLVATLVLAIGLGIGVAGLGALFYHNRIEAVDASVRAEAATVGALVESGQLPDPLPSPAGSPVFAQILGADGTVLATTPSASRVVPIVPLAELRQRSADQPFTLEDGGLGSGPLRVLVKRLDIDGSQVTLVTAVPLGDVRAIFDALLRIVVIAIPLILLAAAIATWLAVGSALHPVDEMREAAEQVAATSERAPPHLPVPASGDELARLAATLNRMLERLHGATEQQRAFVADAAHELRSPIASARAQLEVALSTPTDAAEWQTTATGVREDVLRIGRLADDMLLLARFDIGHGEAREPVDITALLGIDQDPLLVSADAPALSRAFDNVVSNARRHAARTVEVTAEAAGGTVVVTVDDDGPGIPPADRQRVLERWVRLDEGRARDAGGAGLGLAIAQSVIRAHHGTITIDASPLGGTRVVIVLPSATAEQVT